MMNKRQYIYNKVKRVVTLSILMPLSATLFTGCSDFLDILPMNEVVLENYWKEKADVTSAVNGCYEALASQDVVTRFGVWGELRSDNMIAGNATPNDINEILKENLLPSNSLCDWSKVYNVINRCNIVCHYAPEVADIDPNYTTDELNATIAEMVAIRSLCYFYLIRTFRDVPYTTQPTISDDQTFILPATPFNAVLDSLINDLDKVKDNALRRTSQERVSGKTIVVPEENNSRITRWAIYALLADLYLWKGDWDNAIKCCDAIFAYKKEIYDELVLQDQINDVALYHDIPLILESSDKSQNVGNTYRKIFGTGNSFESIFEIYYTGNADQNNWVDPYYTDGNTVMGRLKAADFLMEGFTTDNNQVFLSQTDCRAYENMRASGTSYAIAKYARTSANFSLQKLGSVTVSDSYRASKNANWIFYRLTDVMLMKAEALIERGEEDFPAAFELIDDVYRRANNIEPESTAKSLDIASYSISKPKMEDLLFEERHRELMFEGKRWFDLVRATQREEETTRLSLNVMRKHQQDVNVIKIKLADPNYIYFPYARKELKANPLLVQNPAYNKGDEGVLQ